MLQLRMACAWSEEVDPLGVELGVKLRVNAVLASTPVRGVLSIVPVMVEGYDFRLAGCS